MTTRLTVIVQDMPQAPWGAYPHPLIYTVQLPLNAMLSDSDVFARGVSERLDDLASGHPGSATPEDIFGCSREEARTYISPAFAFWGEPAILFDGRD